MKCFSLPQLAGRFLELSVLDQLPNKLPLGILLLNLLGRSILNGEKSPTLEIQQSGRHDQKFPCNRQIFLPHLIQPGKILFGQLFQTNIVDIHLLLLDQVQQEIQRAGKSG